MHWLLRQINTGIDTVQRAVTQSAEEYHGLMDVLLAELADDEHVSDLAGFMLPTTTTTTPKWLNEIFSKSFTMSKTVKTARSTLNCLDYICVTLVSHIGVMIDHLTLVISELTDASVHSQFSESLGVSIEYTRPLHAEMKKIRSEFDSFVSRVNDQSLLVKIFFSKCEAWICRNGGEDDPLLANMKTPIPSREVVESCSAERGSLAEKFSMQKSLSVFGDLLSYFKRLEEMYLGLLSNQRRTLGKHIQTSNSQPKKILIGPSLHTPHMVGCGQCTWVDDNGHVLLSDIQNGRMSFIPPHGAKFLFSRIYRNGKICCLLKHPDTVSIVTIDAAQLTGAYPVIPAIAVRTYTPAEYGIRSILVAQQLPDWYLNVSGFDVSPSRGLCSVFSVESGRMITLDLEPDDEDDYDPVDGIIEDDTNEASAAVEDDNSQHPITRSKSWIDENKFFNADGRAVARHKPPAREDGESPDFEFFN